MSATSTVPTATSNAQTFEIRPLPGSVGAEIIGLDVSRPVNDEDFARIHRAHLDQHVVIFRDQRITPQQQIAFSRRFGVLQIHVLKQFLLANHPEILIVSNIIENGQSIGLGDAGKFWHSDLSYKELPSLGSMLHAQELPAEGGDTLFADMHKAWDQLPALLHRALQRKQIRRQLAPDADPRAARPSRRSGPPNCAHPPGKRPQGAVRQ
jgi:taurine dioxygenase